MAGAAALPGRAPRIAQAPATDTTTNDVVGRIAAVGLQVRERPKGAAHDARAGARLPGTPVATARKGSTISVTAVQLTKGRATWTTSRNGMSSRTTAGCGAHAACGCIAVNSADG